MNENYKYAIINNQNELNHLIKSKKFDFYVKNKKKIKKDIFIFSNLSPEAQAKLNTVYSNVYKVNNEKELIEILRRHTKLETALKNLKQRNKIISALKNILKDDLNYDLIK